MWRINMNRKLSLLFAIFALLILSCSDATNESIAQNKKSTPASQGKQMEHPNFKIGFNEGLEKAAKENKNMIVDFYTDWCHWCKVMDEKTFNHPEVARKLSDRFVTVRINAEDPNQKVTFKGHTFNHIELTRAFQVTGFPSLAFISPQHEVITVLPGYIPAEQFGYILDYIDQKCWEKKMTLEEFMKRKGNCGDSDASQASPK